MSQPTAKPSARNVSGARIQQYVRNPQGSFSKCLEHSLLPQNTHQNRHR